MFSLIVAIAWFIVCVRSAYKVVMMFNRRSQTWLEILFHASVFIIALSFILPLF